MELQNLTKEQMQALRKTDVSGSALSDLAKEIYFKDVLVDKYRDNFLLELQKRKVIDKRENGFHCCYCSKISEKETAFVQMDRVIFPKKMNQNCGLLILITMVVVVGISITANGFGLNNRFNVVLARVRCL